MAPFLCDSDVGIIQVFEKGEAYFPILGDILLHRSEKEWVLHRIVEDQNSIKRMKGDRTNYYDGESWHGSWGRLIGIRRRSKTYLWSEDTLLGQRFVAKLSAYKNAHYPKLIRWAAFAAIATISFLQRAFVLPKYRYGGPVGESMSQKEWALQHLRYKVLLFELDELFVTNNIKALLCKGLAIAYRYFDEPLDRRFSDLDLFFEPKDFEEIRRLLLSIGFIEFKEKRWEGTKHKSVFHRSELTVEIHSRFSPTMPVTRDHFRHGRSTEVERFSAIFEPSAEDHFLYLCVHAAQQHLFDEPRWLEDLELLLRREKDMDWSSIAIAAKKGMAVKSVRIVLSLIKRDSVIVDPRQMPIPREFRRRTALNLFLPLISRRRIDYRRHRSPRWLYLMLKFQLRDSPWQAIRYSVSRFGSRLSP